MTWSAVGTWHGASTASLSLSNQAAGNLLIAEVLNFSNSTVWCTGLTGGGATWTQAGVKFSGTANGFSAAVFLGKVTATGAQTATPTWSGTAPASYGIAAQEFHSTVGAWAFDKQGNLDSAGTGNWPGLTAGSGAGELYFGYAANITSAAAGSTSGYVYNANVDSVNNGAAYNVNCPATSTFPVWADGEQALGIMILVAETAFVPSALAVLPLLAPGWFPGSAAVTQDPGGIPFYAEPQPTDATPAVIIPPTPEAAPARLPLLPPGWFPGSAAVTQDPGGIPFYSEPAPADPSLAVLPPPAPDILGIADWLPLPPGWFPGASQVTTDPGSIPFYSLPQPQTPPPAPAPLPVITGQAGGTFGWFTDQFGTPRMHWSDEAWGLPANAGRWNGGNWRGDYDAYHAARAAQGLTGNICHPWGHTHTGCNNDLGHTWDGVFPFLVGGATADLTGQAGTITLNDPFWVRIDYMLASAAGAGMTVYLDLTMSNDMPTGAGHGFANGVFQNASTTQIQAACQLIAARYAATPNLIWFFGDDYYNDDDVNFNAARNGIAAADPRVTACTAIEYYPTGNTSRYDLSGAPGGETPHGWGSTYATFSFVYSYQQTYFGVEYAYTEPSPLGPVIWGDGLFTGTGDDGPNDVRTMRFMVWWALASGARGCTMGDETAVQWPSNGLAHITASTWHASSAAKVRAYFEGLPGWHKLIPDTGNQLVTSGRGTRGTYRSTNWFSNTDTDTYVAASRTPDGSLAVLYGSQGMSVTVNQALLGAGYTATWVDPASTATQPATPGSTYNSAGLGSNSRGDPDWVLVLQGPPVTASSAAAAPQPPGWFPGADKVTALPGGIPFYVTPQPASSPPAAGAAAGTAAAAGAGAVTAVITQDAGTSTAAAAAGTATAAGALAATASSAGAGVVTAAATQAAGASIAGAGAAGPAPATQIAPATAPGAAAVTDVVTQIVIASAAAAGSVTATGSGGGAATASIAGAGAATAVATQIAPASAAGAGSAATTATQIAKATAAGAGSATANGQITGTANVAGAGAATAKAVQAAPATAAAAGTLSALATQQAIAAITAAGTATAAGTVQVPVLFATAAAGGGIVTPATPGGQAAAQATASSTPGTTATPGGQP